MLRRRNRLRLKRDFDRVWSMGKRFRTKIFNVVVAKNDLEYARFAVVVPKYISKKAVVRNRLKRLVSEYLRVRMDNFPGGYDILIVVGRRHFPFEAAGLAPIRDEIEVILRRIK